jgi:hypothetical protein
MGAAMTDKPYTSWVGWLNWYVMRWVWLRLARVTPSNDDNTTIGMVVLLPIAPWNWSWSMGDVWQIRLWGRSIVRQSAGAASESQSATTAAVRPS